MVYKQKIKLKSIINQYKPIIKRVVFNRDQKKVNEKLISFLETKLFYSFLLNMVLPEVGRQKFLLMQLITVFHKIEPL